MSWDSKSIEIDNIIDDGYSFANANKISKLLGVNRPISRKYFDRKCKVCSKTLYSTDISLFLKTQGRYENIMNDRRDFLCQEHLAEYMGITSEEMNAMLDRFIITECNLFS